MLYKPIGLNVWEKRDFIFLSKKKKKKRNYGII